MDKQLKYFIFDISKYKGYRYYAEKSNITSYTKIKIDGFNIRNHDKNSISFNIDKTLLRKLKIKKLNNEIIFKENNILQLIEKSKEISYEENNNITWSYYSSYYSNTEIIEDKYEKYQKEERKKFTQNTLNKQYNQKAKKYEKFHK